MFNWNNVLQGLDEGLDVVEKVAPLAGMPALGAVADLLDAIVESKRKDVGINNDVLIEIFEKITKSTHNKADDELIAFVKLYINAPHDDAKDKIAYVLSKCIKCPKG